MKGVNSSLAPTRLRRFKTSIRRRALETVEAALALPVILMLTFAAIEYGWMFLKQQQITNTARQAARIGATPQATNARVTAAVNGMMSDAGLGGSGYALSFSPGDVSAVEPGSLLQVRIAVDYSNVTITNISLLPLPDQLSAQVVMAKEGT